MALDPVAEARGLACLLGLLLWPGLAVARAPWPAVPFLSASFWLLSWWWVPSGPPRSSFLVAALLFFFLLSLLRLLKPLPLRPASGPALLVPGLAGACLLPLLKLVVAPGLSLASAEATLLVWRDGFPSTYEPLLPIPAFGAHAPGLPLLAADVALLSGLPPYRAVALVSLGAGGFLVLASWMPLARSGHPQPGLWAGAAAAALLGLVLVLGGPAPGPPVLALALGLAALSLARQGSGRASAVAAGFVMGAALTVELPAAGLLLLGLAAAGGDRGRRALAVALGLALAGPRIVATARSFTPAELRIAVAEAAWAAARSSAGGTPDQAALRAMAWLRDHTHPLARVCVAASGPGRFLPALASRAAEPAEVPPVYREEAARTPRPGCRYRARFGLLEPGSGPAAAVAFREGSALVEERQVLAAP